MKHLIGMESNAYTINNEFGIDFVSFKERGIDSLDFQDLTSVNSRLFSLSDTEFKSYFSRLILAANQNGLIVNQLHALWDPIYEYQHPEEDMFSYYEKAIFAASIMKTKYVVIHPIPVKGVYLWDKVDCQQLVDVNKSFFNRLLPIAKEKGVYLAIENLPFLNVKEFFSPTGTLNFVNDFNDSHIVMCLDTGHFNMFKDEKIYDFLIKGKDKIKVLHIHDNKGSSDSHLIPYLGTFDWEMFIKGLKDINYDGVLSLETKIINNGLTTKAFNLLDDSLITIIKDIRDKIYAI